MDPRHLTLNSAPTKRCDRRAFLGGACATLLGSTPLGALAHNAAGAVSPPEPPPPVSLTFHDDTSGSLLSALSGQVSAVQLMFTSCRATCPIQGSLFAAAAKKLTEAGVPGQLLSISIDPAQDTPAALRDWLKRFGPSPQWRAARPDQRQLEPLISFLKSKNAGPDPHTAQVYFFDRQGRLVLRSVDFPPATEIVRALQQLSRKARAR